MRQKLVGAQDILRQQWFSCQETCQMKSQVKGFKNTQQCSLRETSQHLMENFFRGQQQKQANHPYAQIFQLIQASVS